MEQTLKKKLQKDPNGLLTYEYIANNIGNVDDIIDELVENVINVDRTGQFVVSTACYLHAIDHEKYANAIDNLVQAAIDKDREHVYLSTLAAAIWGNDYQLRAQQLCASDNNFRRIFKRLYPSTRI